MRSPEIALLNTLLFLLNISLLIASWDFCPIFARLYIGAVAIYCFCVILWACGPYTKRKQHEPA